MLCASTKGLQTRGNQRVSSWCGLPLQFQDTSFLLLLEYLDHQDAISHDHILTIHIESWNCVDIRKPLFHLRYFGGDPTWRRSDALQ